MPNPEKTLNKMFHKAVWTLYLRYGFESYPDYLANRRKKLRREDVLTALTQEAIRDSAVRAAESYERRAAEIRELIAEAASGKSADSTDNQEPAEVRHDDATREDVQAPPHAAGDGSEDASHGS